MAGKSTLCRSTLALVLLANTGLFCPCGPGTVVPRYSSFLASSYVSHDSPLEKKSFFLQEAQQLKAVLEHTLERSSSSARPREGTQQQPEHVSAAAGRDTTAPFPQEISAASTSGDPGGDDSTPPRSGLMMADPKAGQALANSTSFIILDEPCKGTAPKCGAALFGALVEAWGSVRSQGIITTHLHDELKALPLQLPRGAVAFKQMRLVRNSRNIGSQGPVPERQENHSCGSYSCGAAGASSGEDGEGYSWRFELLDGICNDSNALQAAQVAGFPPAVLQRASSLRSWLSSPHGHRRVPDFGFDCADGAGHHQQRSKDAPSPSMVDQTPPRACGDSFLTLTDQVLLRAATAQLLQSKLMQLRKLLSTVAMDTASRSSTRDSGDATLCEGGGPQSEILGGVPSTLVLPPPPQRLAPPPSWVGAACVYILVALERTFPTNGGRPQRAEELISPNFSGNAASPAAVQPPLQSFRVYVGESENIEDRLRRHRQSSQWAGSFAVVLQAEDRGQARYIETQTIQALLRDPEVIVKSLKDGNKKGGYPMRRAAKSCQEQVGRLMAPCDSRHHTAVFPPPAYP